MNTYPFSVFKRADRPYFLVSFKDETGKFLPPVSSKKKTESEAMEVAFKWLRDGIPQKQAAVRVHDLSLKDVARKIKTGAEAETLLSELKRLGWVKSYVLNETQAAQNFTTFLSNFWDWETSPYIREKRRKNHGIHKKHCKAQGQAVKLYWEPFFEGRFLGDITAMDIDAFINHMGEKDISASRKNVVIKAGTKPLRWAFTKGLIEIDPTRGHILFSGIENQRQILNPNAVAAAFSAEWKDERAKLANMLAAVTGMRSGEIMALRCQDLGQDRVFVRASWNREDGLKPPKNNETRTVYVPFPEIMNGLMEQARQNPWGVTPDSFVFWSTAKNSVPVDGILFVHGLRDVLTQIGFSEIEAAKYVFHGWRHFFTSHLIRKLDKKLLKSQTGHKTDEMLAHYGDHELVGDMEIIQETTRETFSCLIPQRKMLLENKGEVITTAA